MISHEEIGLKVKKLRIGNDCSQQELADVLTLPRSSISKIESGERALTTTELLKLSSFFRIAIDDIFEINLLDKSNAPEFNRNKFRELILYIASRCGAKPNVGKTVLYKLSYFSDFDFYELYGRPLTGMSYRKIAHGPAPIKFEEVLDEMIKNDEIRMFDTEYKGKNQIRFIPTNKDGSLTTEERQVVNNVISRLSDMNATQISNYSHDDAPWLLTTDKEIIDYISVYNRSQDYSVRYRLLNTK